MTITPDMSLEQRMGALSVANERRAQVAAVRRQLASGSLPITDALLRPPAAIIGWPITDVLAAAPRFGTARVAGINEEAVKAGLNLLLPIGAAPQRTREWVAARSGPLSDRDRVRRSRARVAAMARDRAGFMAHDGRGRAAA